MAGRAEQRRPDRDAQRMTHCCQYAVIPDRQGTARRQMRRHDRRGSPDQCRDHERQWQAEPGQRVPCMAAHLDAEAFDGVPEIWRGRADDERDPVQAARAQQLQWQHGGRVSGDGGRHPARLGAARAGKGGEAVKVQRARRRPRPTAVLAVVDHDPASPAPVAGRAPQACGPKAAHPSPSTATTGRVSCGSSRCSLRAAGGAPWRPAATSRCSPSGTAWALTRPAGEPRMGR